MKLRLLLELAVLSIFFVSVTKPPFPTRLSQWNQRNKQSALKMSLGICILVEMYGQWLHAPCYRSSLIADNLKRLSDSSKAAEAIREKWSNQVVTTHNILVQVKEAYTKTKAVVRNNYPQEEWIKYSVSDKR